MTAASKIYFKTSVGEKIAFIIVALLAFCFICAKFTLFNGLEYLSDVAAHTQQSFSWLQGRPLFSENFRGLMAWYHNDFILLLFGPLTYFFGAQSFFLAHNFVLAGASVLFIIGSRHQTNRLVRWFGVTACFFACWGPYAFWNFDNPEYGFHSADLYLPLATLYASLTAIKWRHSWICLLLVASIHEGGPLIAMMLHIIGFVFCSEPQTPFRNMCIPILKIMALWGFFFLGGIFILKTFGGGSLRYLAVATAKSLWAGSSEHWSIVESHLKKFLILFMGLILLLGSTLRPTALVLFLLTSLPSLVVGFVSALAYYPGMDVHGLHWGPRFAPFIAIAAAISIVSTCSTAHTDFFAGFASKRPRLFSSMATFLLIVTFWYQKNALDQVRAYEWLPRLEVAFLTHRTKLHADNFNSQEMDLLRCLNRSLPRYTKLHVSGGLATAFQLVDYTWNNNSYRQGPSEIFLCDRRNRVTNYECTDYQDALDPHLYDQVDVYGLRISFVPAVQSAIQPCLPLPSGRS